MTVFFAVSACQEFREASQLHAGVLSPLCPGRESAYVVLPTSRSLS
jgi:hypothetical protein